MRPPALPEKAGEGSSCGGLKEIFSEQTDMPAWCNGTRTIDAQLGKVGRKYAQLGGHVGSTTYSACALSGRI